MKALITGASSGLGLDFANTLNNMGYELILVSKDKTKLESVCKKFKNSKCISMDLSEPKNVLELYNQVKDDDIDILINNAGYGLIGDFTKTSLDRELNMIDLNVKSVHILTKLFMDDMIKKDKGYILNVASSAAFQPGPLMSTYYSTKSYVYSLTLALYEEIRKKTKNVHISCLTPGPVDTNFNNVANCEFKVRSLTSEYVARYALRKMFKKKLLIIPGWDIKFVYYFGKFVPLKLKLKMAYKIQYKKQK